MLLRLIQVMQVSLHVLLPKFESPLGHELNSVSFRKHHMLLRGHPSRHALETDGMFSRMKALCEPECCVGEELVSLCCVCWVCLPHGADHHRSYIHFRENIRVIHSQS